MNKILLAVAVIGVLISGCTKKEVVRPSEQSKQDNPAANKTEQDKSGQITSMPTEKVTSLDVAEKSRTALSKTIRRLQEKLKDIHFDYDKYVITIADKPLIKEVANVLEHNRAIKVTIEGNCDERGTTEYNLALGDKRAAAAREYLLTLGVPSNKIDTVSYGKEKPLCEESTEKCWAQNRRDHFVLN